MIAKRNLTTWILAICLVAVVQVGCGRKDPPPTQDKETSSAGFEKRLAESLALGRQFLLNCQTDEGNFRYKLHLVTGEVAPEENSVRQAGTLWGLSLLHLAEQSDETRAAVSRGLEFFRTHSRLDSEGRAYIAYPGAVEGSTGTVALVALAWIEWLRCEDVSDEEQQLFDGYIAFLRSLRRHDHHYQSRYDLRTGTGWDPPSPYFDGETLLALVKTARHLERADLREEVLASADAMYREYVDVALSQDPDSNRTKGFYQWGSMALTELHESGWPATEQYGAGVIRMAHWMIDAHEVLRRKGNTGYAYEGISSAWSVAVARDDQKSVDLFRRTIEQGMTKLMTWQVGSKQPTAFLQQVESPADAALGGVMTSAADPWLRIDTTQHHVHALLLIRKYLFSK